MAASSFGLLWASVASSGFVVGFGVWRGDHRIGVVGWDVVEDAGAVAEVMEELGEVLGRFGLEGDALLGVGVVEGEGVGVEGLSVDEGGGEAVDGVAGDGEVDGGEVDADLVSASGDESALEEGGVGE